MYIALVKQPTLQVANVVQNEMGICAGDMSPEVKHCYIGTSEWKVTNMKMTITLNRLAR